MLKRLHEHGLVAHRRYRGVVLTDEGRRVALRVLRHHRLLETYLAQSLGVPWDRVHEEAEVLEHVLSDELEALIAAKLGHPTHDPHGHPIPSAELVLEDRPCECLASLEAGATGVLARVSTRRCCATSPRAASRRAPASRCSSASRSAGPLFVRFGDALVHRVAPAVSSPPRSAWSRGA